MSTISEKLTRLNTYKTNIKAAILEKGESVADDMSKYAEAIQNIQAGGGGSDSFESSMVQGTLNSSYSDYSRWNVTDPSITEYAVPSNITAIANCAFYNHYNLKTVTYHSNVEAIGGTAFFGCNKMTTRPPKSVKYIGASAFNNCRSLPSELLLPIELVVLQNMAFAFCNLTTVYFGDKVMFIGQSAFNQNKNLELVDFGNNRTTIPTLAAANAFAGTSSNLMILVPDDLYDDWKAATNWTAYADKIYKYSDFSGA